MAEAVADPRHREVRQELISKTLTTLAKGVQWLLLALLFSILTEWVGMVFWWPDEGLQHSRSMLEAEIGYLDSDFRRSVVTSSPAEFAKTVADKTYYVLFEFTGLLDLITWVSTPPTPPGCGAACGAHETSGRSLQLFRSERQLSQPGAFGLRD